MLVEPTSNVRMQAGSPFGGFTTVHTSTDCGVSTMRAVIALPDG
jgi:hypothetical protein